MSLTAPTADATVSGTVTLTATASDNVGVAGVQFQVDGTHARRRGHHRRPTACRGTPPRPPTAAHTLTAVARDAAGNNTTSPTVTVTVNNAGHHGTHGEPHRSRRGATVSGTVTLTATASDNVGVAGVQFMLDGATLGAEDTTSRLGRVVGHHHGRQRHPHADRTSPRRRRQHHHLADGDRHRQQRADTTAPAVWLSAATTPMSPTAPATTCR